MHGLHLDPARAAAAGRVGRADRLDDDALLAGGERVARDALGDVGIGRHLAGDAMLAGDALELAHARRQRFVEQVATVDVQHVEEPRMQQRLARRLGAEPRHRLLERPRPAVFIERERLAVEDHVAHRHPSHHLDDLGKSVGDVGEVAREHPHVVAGAVHLDARAVELVFDGCLARRRDRVGRARGGGREHRQHRATDHEPDVVELGRGAREREPGGLAEVARQHRRATHHVAGPVGGTCDGVGEHALERPGAHVAEQCPTDEALLALGGPRRELAQRAGTLARRSGTGGGGEPIEQFVEVGDAERRLRRGLAHRGGHAAPADADAPLSRLADEEPDGRARSRRARGGATGRRARRPWPAATASRRRRRPWSRARRAARGQSATGRRQRPVTSRAPRSVRATAASTPRRTAPGPTGHRAPARRRRAPAR